MSEQPTLPADLIGLVVPRVSLPFLAACGARFADWGAHQQDCEPCGEVPF